MQILDTWPPLRKQERRLSSVQFSLSVMSDSWDPMDCSTPALPVHQQLPELIHKLMSIELVLPSNHLILCCPLLLCLQSFLASGFFPVSQLFASGGQSIGVSASASVLSMNIQDWFPYNWLIGSLCSPRDSQESSPTPQFKSINSSALSFLYSPSLTSIHDYWKNHSLD